MKAGKYQTPYAGKGVHLDALPWFAVLRRFTLPRRRNYDAGISDDSTPGEQRRLAGDSFGLLQQLGHFLLYAVGLRQGGDAGLAQNFVLGHVGGCRRIVRGLYRVLC